MNQKNNHRKMTLTLLQVYLETKQMMLQVLRRRLATKIRGGGSVVGHETKFRNRTEGNKGLMKDYFDPDPVYDDKDFRRRFRMKRSLFLKIVEKVQETDTFLVKKKKRSWQAWLLTNSKGYGCHSPISLWYVCRLFG